MIRICHISDTHGYHNRLNIPECDVLAFTGDLGGRTNLNELAQFLVWFEAQPADLKVFIAGNHDIVLDKQFPIDQYTSNKIDSVQKMIMVQNNQDAMKLIESYNVKYLCNSACEYKGYNIYGSPYSPSFHRAYWAFNADRGEEISKRWADIPSDVNLLMTHTPVYGMLDDLKQYARPGEDIHAGCQDLLRVIKKRLIRLKLHMGGHIHENYGVIQGSVSNTRRVLFSNGAVLDNTHKQVVVKPSIINI